MSTITLEEAQDHLAEVISQLSPGEPVIITLHDKPIARLIAAEASLQLPRKAGTAKGLLTILVEDEEHLQDFAGSME